MELVIASNNKNKIIEITQILGNFFDKLYSLKDLGIEIEIEETGATFYENALIKAKAISELTNMVAVSDDSGLEVNALNFAPGVFSARYAQKECDDLKNNDLILKNMEKITDRRARFVSSIVLYYPNGKVVSAKGITEGEILYKGKGNNGFGYDPLFYSYDLKKSFGESNWEEKNLVSHRARALEQLKDILTKETIS
jgi:XTP/dITP diphosphohydrolase